MARTAKRKLRVRFSNPGYEVRGLTVKTFKDDEGDWGWAVYDVGGEPLAIGTGEPSEKIAAREGKAEAAFHAEILEAEGREMRFGNPRGKKTKKRKAKHKRKKNAKKVGTLVREALK